MLKQMDDAYARPASMATIGPEEAVFIVVDFPEFRQRAWYIEVSLQRIDEARRAVNAAAKEYEAKLSSLRRRCTAATSARSVASRGYQIQPRSIARPLTGTRSSRGGGGCSAAISRPQGRRSQTQRPESNEFTFHCLNVPEPAAVIVFWRESASA
jgi:hypothetical protein